LCEWLQALCKCAEAQDQAFREIQKLSGTELQLAETLNDLNRKQIALENARELKSQLDESKMILTSLKSATFDPVSELKLSEEQMRSDPWLNALTAVRIVYLNALPTQQRPVVWKQVKRLTIDLIKDVEVEMRAELSNTLDRDGLDRIASAVHHYNFHEWMKSRPNLLHSMTCAQFPAELKLSPSEGKLAPTLECAISLQSFLSTLNPWDRSTLPPIPLVFDPDCITVKVLKALNSEIQEGVRDIRWNQASPEITELSLTQDNFAEKFRTAKLNDLLHVSYQSTHFVPIPFDMTLTPLECAGALVQTLCELDPTDTNSVQSLRREESELLQEVQRNKASGHSHDTKWCELLINLSKLIETDCVPSTLTRSIQRGDLATLTQFHIHMVQLISSHTATQRRLRHCQTQRQRLERQRDLNAALTGARGLRVNTIRHLTLLLSLINDPLAYQMRFPCSRLCQLVTECAREVIEAYRVDQNVLKTENPEAAQLRHLSRLALNVAVNALTGAQHAWNHPSGVEFRLKLAIGLSRLRSGPVKQSGLWFDPEHVQEFRWLERLFRLLEPFTPQHLQWIDNENGPMIDLLKEIESSSAQLRGLLHSLEENRNVWDEMLNGPITFLRPMPGVAAGQIVSEHLVFFIWSILRPQRLYEAAKQLIDHEFSAFHHAIDHSPNPLLEEMNQRRYRINDLFFPKRLPVVEKSEQSCTEFASPVYVLIPRSLPELCSWSVGGEQPLDVEILSTTQQASLDYLRDWAKQLSWVTVEIDLIDCPSENAENYNLTADRNTVVLIKNSHLLDVSRTSTANSWTVLKSFVTALLKDNCDPSQSDRLLGRDQARQSLMWKNEQIRVFLDFTGCRSLEQLANVIRRLPRFCSDEEKQHGGLVHALGGSYCELDVPYPPSRQ
uniref:Conserved oligomeric Golgi complex subunit 7 n=1 Tax=Echinostoma caproni TaxID=27848 RepID=A0A183AFD7_9TREM